MGAITSTVAYIENFFFRIAQIVLVILMLFSTFDTTLRYVFHQSIGGGYEIIAEYMMPYLVYLSISYVFRTGGHIRVTLLTDALSKKVQSILMVITNFLSLTLFCFITYATFFKVLKAYEIGERSANVLAYLLWPAYVAVLIGVVLLIIRLIVTIIKREDPYEKAESAEL